MEILGYVFQDIPDKILGVYIRQNSGSPDFSLKYESLKKRSKRN
jgi:hypothetical protein